MHYGDDTSTSISTYYFEAKGRDENNYKAIVIIFAVSIMLPLAAFVAFGYVAFDYSDWIIDYTVSYVRGNYKQEIEKEATGSSSKENKIENTIELSSLKDNNYAFGNDSLHIDQNIVTEETPFTSSSANAATSLESSSCQAKDIKVEVMPSCNNNKTIAIQQQYKEKEQDKNEQKNSSDGEQHKGKNKEEEVADYRSRKVNVMALSITFLLLSIALFVFHILASVKLIHYGNEVLYDENDDHGSPKYGFEGSDAISNNKYNLFEDDQCVPIVYTAVSFLPSAILTIFAPFVYCYVAMELLHGSERFNETCCAKCLYWFYSRFSICGGNDIKHYKNTDDESNGDNINKKTFDTLKRVLKKSKGENLKKAAQRIAEIHDTNNTLGLLFQVSFGGFLVYLGFYFLPYMALAFINDPIQTGFIYLIGATFTFSVFIIIKAFLIFIAVKCGWLYSKHITGQTIFVTATGISIAYFLIIFLFILTLGNFHDFQAIENLTLPIIIGLLSLFVIKPAIKYVKIEAKRKKLDFLPQ